MKQGKVKYGNWVPTRLLFFLWGITGISIMVLLLGVLVVKSIVLSIVAVIILAPSLAMSGYMQICHWIFSFEGGQVMEKIHSFLLIKMNWNGNGNLLDIGCGSGALTIGCAKKFPDAQIVGVDFWGKEWDYAKEQCEKNSKAENVADRITFMQQDAANLSFESEMFDAVISNFVFHEVKTQPYKLLVVKEALRVVKPGGVFVFHDLFEHREIYGDMKALIEALKKEGIKEIHYEPHTEKLKMIPGLVKTPWMLSGIGILYGVK